MEWNKKHLRSVFLGVAGCVVLFWVLSDLERLEGILGNVGKVLSPFVVGAVIAFILNVPMRAIEKCFRFIKNQSARRGIAIVFTFIGVLLVLTGVVYLLVPQLVDTVETLLATLPGFFQRCIDDITAYLNDNPELMEWVYENTDFQSINWSELIQKAISWISSSLDTIVTGALGTVISLGTGVFNGIISTVFAIYCLARKEILARQGRRLVYAILPEKFCDETVRILRMSNSTFSNFISGQVLEALILGSMFAVSMSIFKMPYIPLVSVIIAVTALVPIVGAFAGCIVGAFFILVNDPMQAVWFVVMFLVLQQIEGNMIYPRVVGTSVGLPGMWVLVAVAIGGNLMGVGGMLLMIPLSSVLYALAREYTNKWLEKKGIDRKKLQDQPPVLRSGFKQKRIKEREIKRKLKKQKKVQEENQNET